MPNVRIVGIAGGSGSGKSTLAVALAKAHPESIALLHLDDYYCGSVDAPKHGKYVNWEHPSCVYFDDLLVHLEALASGRAITVRTNSELYNPNFVYEKKNFITHTIEPKPIILLEGFLALYDKRIRALMDLMIYLDIPIQESAWRRKPDKFAPDETYVREVLVPMHTQHVLPTRGHAQIVIDTLQVSKEETYRQVEQKVLELLK